MREIVHVQGGQCGNQIGAKINDKLGPEAFRKTILKKMPKNIDTILGTKIIEIFDSPEIFRAINSSFFLIFKKNQIPDIKIINGIIL